MAISKLYSANSIIGDRVENAQGDDLGRVEDIILDARTGHAAYAILSSPFVDDRKWFAVPWRAFRPAPEEDALILDVPTAKLKTAPRFNEREWPDMSDPAWSSEIHSYYGYEPYWQEQDRRVVARTYDDRRPGRGWLAAAVLLVLLLGGLTVFLVARQDPSTAATLEETAITVKQNTEDMATTAKVKSALALSKQVSAFDIDVDTVRGVVTLSGAVPSERIKAFALAIAEDTAGVNAVRDALVVNPGITPIPTRERLTQRVGEVETALMIREALDNDPQLKNQAIDSRLERDVVILSGQVADDFQRQRAEELALNVDGVAQVVNNIIVSRDDRQMPR